MLPQTRALDRKANKPEKLKVQKDGSVMWTEVHELAELVRSGKVGLQGFCWQILANAMLRTIATCRRLCRAAQA